MESFLLTIDLYDHHLIKIYESSDIVKEALIEATDPDYEWKEYDIPGVGKICSFTGKEIGNCYHKIFDTLEQFKYEIIKDKDTLKRDEERKHNFNKCVHISNELADFIGIDRDVKVNRPVITKKIIEHIMKHKLCKENNKREIDLSKPGGKELADLLEVPIDTNLTIFNLITYYKKHIVV